MEITANQVVQIAQLARLELAPKEIDALARDLGSILDHMRELEQVDVGEVGPMGGVSEHPAPLRPDAVGADPLYVPIDEMAPARAEGFFLVPRLPALDADAHLTDGGSA